MNSGPSDKKASMSGQKPTGATPQGMKPAGEGKDAQPVGTKVPGKG